MRSERQEKAKEEAAPEIQYTQKEVAEMLQNAGDISRQQKKQDRNANVIAGFLVIGVAAAAWAAKIVNVGGGLILGGLVAAAFVSLWYFFQNLDDEESRKVYGAASILSIGILASLVNFVWGDQLAEFIPGGLERKEQIFWTLWYLFVLVMMMIGTIRCIRRQRQKKEEKLCSKCDPWNTVVVISADHMGEGDEELGKVLIKGFIYALTEQDVLPQTILFYNGGAKLTCEESPTLEDLKSLEAQGVEILTCGTCLNHYGLTDKLQVGSVTNMYVIAEKMTQAGNIVKP